MSEYAINLISILIVHFCVFLIWLFIFAGDPDPIPSLFWWLVGGDIVYLIAWAIYKANYPKYY